MALTKARRPEEEMGLNITSMMDMMTIILVFLLKSYSTQDISIAPSEDMELPISTTKKPPEIAVNLVVTKSQLIVDGKTIVKLNPNAPDPLNPGQTRVAFLEDDVQGPQVTKLYEVLDTKANEAREVESRIDSEGGFKGRLLIQCDKKLPFEVLRKVLWTAGQAKFSEFKFVVYKQE